MKRSLSLVGGVLAGTLLFAAGTAHAHIKMLKPTSWLKDDATGGAQEKGGPCGTTDSYDAILGNTDTPSGVVTTFQAGETITVEWSEYVDHPGYFRIALAENRADLKDPTVPFTNAGNCDVDQDKIPTTAHDNVLADGILITNNAASRPNHPNYTFQVTLPNKPCEKCTLQLIQFMENHPPDCIYYHCADIKIVAGGAGDAGVGDAGATKDAGGQGAQVDASTATRDSGTTTGTGGTLAGTTPSTGGTTSGTVATTAGGSTPGGTASTPGGTTGGATTGGTTGGLGTTTGTVGTGTSDDDGGCSIALGGGSSSTAGWLGAGVLALILARRSRRRA